MSTVLAVGIGGILLWFVIFVACIAIGRHRADPSAPQMPRSHERRRGDKKRPCASPGAPTGATLQH